MSTTTVLLDDAKRADARNGAPAAGSVLKDVIDALKTNACRYRPIYSMWGGDDLINQTIITRHQWLNSSPGSPGLGSVFLVLPSTGVPTTTQSIEMGVGGVTFQDSYTPAVARNTLNPMRYPIAAEVNTSLYFDQVGGDNGVRDIWLGSKSANGPQLRSALVFERQNATPVETPTAAPSTISDNWLVPGSWIIGTGASDIRTRSVRAVRDYWRRVYKGRCLTFGWSGISPGSATPYDGQAVFTGGSYRYIFDQNIGDGGGVAPSVSGGGITVPLKNAASGRNVTTRVYVSAYCRQVGGGTGSLGYSHRNPDGTTMTAIGALTNPIAVTSSSWAWYGMSTTFNPAADCYLTADTTLDYDRIVLCGKTTGGTSFEVGAFTFAAYHSAA
jgi:hypothetical protein